jgi:hypothetical protein
VFRCAAPRKINPPVSQLPPTSAPRCDVLKTPGFGPISLKGVMPMQATRSLLLLIVIFAAPSGASGQSISPQDASAGALRTRASPRSTGKTRKRCPKLASDCPDSGRCFLPRVNALPSRSGARVGRGNPRAANRHDPDAASGMCFKSAHLAKYCRWWRFQAVDSAAKSGVTYPTGLPICVDIALGSFTHDGSLTQL